jgi:hypothetical protein
MPDFIEETLRNNLEEKRAKLKSVSWRRLAALLAAPIIFTVFAFGIMFSDTPNTQKMTPSEKLLGAIAFSVVFSSQAYLIGREYDTKAAKREVRELEDELDLHRISSVSREQKAHKLLRIQQSQLSVFFDLIFQQSRGIFWVGVSSLGLGFVIIGATMWYVGTDLQTRDPANMTPVYDKAIVAVIGAIGAILTNYVATIYLKMFSEIIQTVNHSVNSMTASTHLNFANVLISNIDDQALRDSSLKELSAGLKPTSSGT